MASPWHAGDPFAALQWQGDADPAAAEFVAAVWDALGAVSPAGIATAWLNAHGILKAALVRDAIPPPPPSVPGPPTPQVVPAVTPLPSPELTAAAAQWLTERGFLDRTAASLAAVLPGLWAQAWDAGTARAQQAAADFDDDADDRKRKKKKRKKKAAPSPAPQPPPSQMLTPQQRLARLLATPAFQAFVAANLAAVVGLITGSLVRRVASLLALAIVLGWTAEQLARALEQAFLTRWRAEMIAATEASRATTAAMVAFYKLVGIKWVRWQTRNDSRVCPKCLKNQKKGTVKLGDKFPSGDKWPPAHPRCRCVLMPSSKLRKLLGKGAAPDLVKRRGPVAGERPVHWKEVHDQMAKDFPEKALKWVQDMPWVQAHVPLDMIDFSNEKKWNAAHQPNRVAADEAKIKAGQKVSRVILVDEPNSDDMVVVDGHHHALAYKKLGKPARAFVGKAAKENGVWQETHSSQYPATSPTGSGYSRQDSPAVKGDKGPVAAGVAVRAKDTGRILMLQRALHDGKRASGRWELPGGKLDDGEEPLDAAVREWCEETRCRWPDGKLTGQWTTADGKYQGFVHTVDHEDDVDIHHGRDEVEDPDHPGEDPESVAWWDLDLLRGNPSVRPELVDNLAALTRAVEGKAGKVSKDSVHYRASSGGERCGTCSMWLPDYRSVEDIGHCTLVSGLIHASDVCDKWEPVDEAVKASRGQTSAEILREYWRGEAHPGPTRFRLEREIRWGEPDDWYRCVDKLTPYIGEGAKGYCNLRHHEVLGYWPAQHAEMERGKVASGHDGVPRDAPA
jgi:SPP1 gp7 family putative phage head morphogenesis protein